MSLLAMMCPHCHVENTQFRSVASVAHRVGGTCTVFFTCNACEKGIATLVGMMIKGVPNPHDFPGNLQASNHYTVLELYPQPESLSAPEHTPSSVANPYRQAQDSLRRSNFDAAGAMFRKSLDAAIREIDDGVKGRLHDRIDKLASTNKITPAMKDWAHAIRLDGNDAVYDDDPFSEDDAKQLASFTELFLMYAFTLPELLEARKTKDTPSAKT